MESGKKKIQYSYGGLEIPKEALIARVLTDEETAQFVTNFVESYRNGLTNSENFKEFCEKVVGSSLEGTIESNIYRLEMSLSPHFGSLYAKDKIDSNNSANYVYTDGIVFSTNDFDSFGDYMLVNHYIPGTRNIVFNYEVFSKTLYALGFVSKTTVADSFYSQRLVLMDTSVNRELNVNHTYTANTKKLR